ncbi:replicative DNA helicase [Arcanobacterium sp. S3PF19]|uniref:replicative DNA helicase n=1 Tax=Arcanobacterium sp. S3PF19 TaxID=1219585 RepID=UPI00050F5E10|nr:replicative DNA helicase [Arcanobacterium sp. S3PF19]KGF05680.1 helicase DnaB [Arcanobacterium sp. S3PF19]
MADSETANPGFSRVPPHNTEAEGAVLGSMMINKDAISDVVSLVRATDFYTPKNALIFETIIKIFSNQGSADVITVAAELERSGELATVGGDEYLSDLVLNVPTTANVAYYAKIVQDMSKLRALVNVGMRITRLGYSADGNDVETLLDKAQAEMFAVAESHVVNDYAGLNEILPDVVGEIMANSARDGDMVGLPTGFGDLDSVLLGLRPGQMIIVAARPGMGKSTLAMDFCRNIAIRQNKPVAFFSLEMNRNELVMRALAAESNVMLSKLIRGECSEDEWQKIATTVEKISRAPFFIDDSPNLTMTEIRAKARRLRQQQNIEMIVIDYLQLLTSGAKLVESRQQEVSEFSRSIKLLAKELDIPIIAVAQLNRNPEARQDKKPQVADLRESGSLEQDADVILLIHRDTADTSPDAPPSKIIIGKHRAGPTGEIELMFQGNRSRFAGLSTQPQPDY